MGLCVSLMGLYVSLMGLYGAVCATDGAVCATYGSLWVRDYAAVVFLAHGRYETGKRRLHFLSFLSLSSLSLWRWSFSSFYLSD